MKNDFRWFVLNTWRDSKCGFDTGILNFPVKLLKQQPQNHELIDSTSNALKFQMRKVAHVTAKDTDFPNHLNSTDYFLENFALTLTKVLILFLLHNFATIQTISSGELFVLNHTDDFFLVSFWKCVQRENIRDSDR